MKVAGVQVKFNVRTRNLGKYEYTHTHVSK